MRMYGRANKAAPRDAGFSLLEALTALLIVAMLATAVALLAPSPDRRVQAAAETLAARLQLAQDESILRNRMMGLVVTREGYGFVRLERADWRPLDQAPLAFGPWPQGVAGVVLETSAGQDAAIAARLDPLGAATPVTVRLTGGGHGRDVSLSEEGAVHVRPVS